MHIKGTLKTCIAAEQKVFQAKKKKSFRKSKLLSFKRSPRSINILGHVQLPLYTQSKCLSLLDGRLETLNISLYLATAVIALLPQPTKQKDTEMCLFCT